MAALAIQRTDNFLHTFLQVCGVVICSEAMRADLAPVFFFFFFFSAWLVVQACA